MDFVPGAPFCVEKRNDAFFCVGFLLGFYFLNQFFDEYNREKACIQA